MIRAAVCRGCAPQNLLAWLLRRYHGLEYLPIIARAAQGKPYFLDRPDLCFSYSHTGDLVLCAVGSRPLGADVEAVVPRRAALPTYSFSREEADRWRSLGGNWPAFYTVWTRKEAWSKYTGEGLSRPWKTPPEEDLFFGTYGDAHWRACICGEEPPPEELLLLSGGEPGITEEGTIRRWQD